MDDNEVEAELQEEQGEVIVSGAGWKSNLELRQHAGSSREVQRLTGHERGMKEIEAVTISKK